MHNHLRQSTASQSRIVGPFIDDTDFKTLETGLTIANTDVKLMKNGAASVNKNSGGGTHRVNGDYSLTFDATDTDTIGELEVSISVSGALVVKRTYEVLHATVYDALYDSSPTMITSLDIGQLFESDIDAVTSQTAFSVTGDIVTDDNWIGHIVTIEDVTNNETVTRWITDVFQVSDSIFINAAPPFTVAVGDIIRVHKDIHPTYALNTYDPPTRTELTSDTSSITTLLTQFVQLICRSDSFVAADLAAQLAIINADTGTGVGTYDPETDSIEAILDTIAALENIAGSDVLTQVNAALDTAISELGVATPAATPTIRTGLMLLYMALRNKRDTTAATDEIHDNAGTVIASATVSDDSVTFTKSKYT